MPDPIRAALEAAERETTTAGKVSAFLRAMPEGAGWSARGARQPLPAPPNDWHRAQAQGAAA
jgi:hypothetical protein